MKHAYPEGPDSFQVGLKLGLEFSRGNAIKGELTGQKPQDQKQITQENTVLGTQNTQEFLSHALTMDSMSWVLRMVPYANTTCRLLTSHKSPVQGKCSMLNVPKAPQ